MHSSYLAAIVIFLVIGTILITSMIIQPCAKWNFNIEALEGKASGSWEPLSAIDCLQKSSELTEKTISEIKDDKLEWQIVKELSELKFAEKQQLENEIIILERLSEKDSSLIPVLVTKISGAEKIEDELGTITIQVSSSHVEYMESLDGLNIIATSDEDKDNKFSQIKVLTGPTVQLDQKIYTWTDKVYITITDPWSNTNPNEVEKIGENEELLIITDGGHELRYVLTETGKDTSFFTGEIILTGFSDYDVNNDGFTNDASGTKSQLGPTEGKLPVNNIDMIKVIYQYTDTESSSSSSLVRWNIGFIQFMEASYQLNNIATIRLIDPDLNLNPEAFDFVQIKVISDSSPEGINLLLKETNSSTGIFEGIIKFTTGKPGQNLLKTSLGDTIIAIYIDRTLSDPYSTEDKLEITGTSKIKETLLPG